MSSVASRTVQDLERDPALRLYGLAIAVGHLLAFAHLEWVDHAARLLGPDATPVCWPFFEDCHLWRRLSSSSLVAILFAYGAVALTSALAFALRRVRLAALTLAASALANVAIVLMDYRLRLNQHTMLLWVSVAYLVVPEKRRSLSWLLCAFYVWAGLLKLNAEWLSGEALGGRAPLFVPERLLPAACAYVVVLELVVVFGLFARRRAIFLAAFSQLLAFHLASFSVVGFFYPLLMLALLSLFPLLRAFPRVAVERAPAAPALLVALFSALQLVPRLFPGDPALTGQGRAFALHMFDAPVACRAIATLFERGRSPVRMAMTARLPARIACDPLVYFHFARAICRERMADPAFGDLDLLLESRRGKAGKLVRVVDVPSFCASGTSYRAFGANEWIHGE